MTITPLKKKQNDHPITDRIKPVKDLETTGSYAIYGRAGTGKTTWASSAPKPLLLLDINDKGTDSIADIKGIDVLRIESLDDIEDIYYMLKDGSKYVTVVFDTITEMQKIAMREVVESKKKSTKDLGRWGSMAQKDWGDVASVMNKWIADYRDLPMEVIFLAQERVRGVEDTDDRDNQITPEVGPATMPSIASTLNAAVNVVANTYIAIRRTKQLVKGKTIVKEEPVYRMRVGPNPVYTTKLRKPLSAEAPQYIDNATFEDVRRLVKGTY